jgi:hypothetical protein
MWDLKTSAGRVDAVDWLSSEHNKELHERAQHLLNIKLEEFRHEATLYRQEYIKFVVRFALCMMIVDDAIGITAADDAQQRNLLRACAMQALDIACDHAIALEDVFEFRGGFKTATQSLVAALHEPRLLKAHLKEWLARAKASRIVSQFEDGRGYDEIAQATLGPGADPKACQRLAGKLRQTARRERNKRKLDGLDHLVLRDRKTQSLFHPCLAEWESEILRKLWVEDIPLRRLCCGKSECTTSLDQFKEFKENAGKLLSAIDEFFRQFVRLKVWEFFDPFASKTERNDLLDRTHPHTGTIPMHQAQYEFVHHLLRGTAAGVCPGYLGGTCGNCDRYHSVVRIAVVERKAEYLLRYRV